MKKSDFNYYLPPELIAQYPLEKRDASRLLCLNKNSGELNDSHFTHFLTLINDNDLLVFNNTKVIPARLFGKKSTGGKIEILIERVLDEKHALAHIRASKSPKLGAKIVLENNSICEVEGRENDLFHLVFHHEISVFALLNEIGHIPLPPYIERLDDENDLSRYQTVFAQTLGAVAAPTAGLHFDETTMDFIQKRGVACAFVTLHVGSGTFQPVRVENLNEHLMHQEFFSVPTETVQAIEKTRQNGGRVIAIGTTAVRALESASQLGKLTACSGDTQLFITPPYEFKSVDALLTNFHLPESTLLMLICAFAGYNNVMNAYQHAITQKYRFFSYGDAMFLTNQIF